MHKRPLPGGGSKKGKESKHKEKFESKHKEKVDESQNEQIDKSSKSSCLMSAVVVTGGFGGPEALRVQSVSKPIPKANEVLVKVAYAGVNRPDIQQRKKKQNPNDQRSPYLGLECSGSISQFGEGTEDQKGWRIGDKVCAITNGGSYAEYVVVPIGHLLPIPPDASIEEAATFPQAACTVWSELFMQRELGEKQCYTLAPNENQTLLIHGGSSGIGTFAIQLAKHLGVTVYVTAGSEEKLKACRELGADECINYRTTEEWDFVVLEKTANKGVNAILDCVGNAYHLKNINCLSSGGWLVTIGPTCDDSVHDAYATSSEKYEVSACSLQNRTSELKTQIVDEVKRNVWPLIRKGRVQAYQNNIKPYPFSKAEEAHRRMESGNFFGKILLRP